MVKQNAFHWIVFAMAALFCAIAIYNGYPLVTSDTGAYINNGFHPHMPHDRPLTYSLFLRMASFQWTLWLAVFVQSLIIAGLIYRSIQVLWKTKVSLIHVITIGVLCTMLTSLSWYSSQLMPDIFTSVIALSIFLYLKDSWKAGKFVYPLLIFGATLMHNSNLITLFGFSLLGLIIGNFIWKEHIAKWRMLFFISLLALTLLSLAHWTTGNGFTLSRSSHVFLVAKMSENGMLKKYLDDHCATDSLELCAYKDELPSPAWEFIWNGNSPFHKTGGWENSKKEYNEILKGIISSPKYYPFLIKQGFRDTYRQLHGYEVGDGLYPFKENTNPYWKIQNHYSGELTTYLNSRQNKGKLYIPIWNSIYKWFLILSTIGVLILGWMKKIPKRYLIAYVVIVLFILCNAFVTANFANVLARLNSRLLWTLPLLHIVFLWELITLKAFRSDMIRQ